MNLLPLLFDALLVLALLACAWATLFSRNLFRAVAQFIAFGLLMALAWVRLGASDLAMAEAAIGAGLSGALFLDAIGVFGPGRRQGGRPSAGDWVPVVPLARLPGWLAALPCGLLLLSLVLLVFAHAPPPARLSALLAASMPDSGVAHPVTAVLLNFRGYDTFLEVGVLTVAALANLGLQSRLAEPALRPVHNRLLDALSGWLAPVMLLVAVYLYWVGSKEAGGAFQAGALLAACGLLLRLSGVPLPLMERSAALRLGLATGLGVFLLASLAGPLLAQPPFFLPPERAALLIMAIEGALALSISLALLSLFSAAPGWRETDHG